MIQKAADLLLLTRRELLALVLVFAASLPAVTPRLYSSDEVQYFSYLRSLWFDRDVSFENEYQYFFERGIAQTPGYHETFLERTTPAGRRINFGTVGSAILWAPFYGVADLLVRVLRLSGRDTPADGFSHPYVAAVAYGSAFYGFVAVLLGIGAARRILGGRSLVPGLAVWAGTPLLFYMYLAPPYAHACSAFAVAVVITVWLHVRRTWSPLGAVSLGLAGALAAMVREQDVFILAGPALDFVLVAARRLREGGAAVWPAAAAGLVAFGAGMAPQLLAYQALNGRPGPSGYVTRKMLWHSPHGIDVLFSSAHGFFFWTPLALVALAGLAIVAGSRRRSPDTRRILTCLLVMAAAQVYVSGAVDSWTVSGAFGQRRFVALTAPLIVGLHAIWSMAGRRRARAVLAIAIALGVWWNLALMALFGTRMMDRSRIEVRRNAYDAFVTLPRMAPELAWRYVTVRESFYEPRPRSR